MPADDDIVVLSALRTPIGRFQGALARTPAASLGAQVVRAAIERAGLPPNAVAEVLMGQVLQSGAGQGPARQVAMAAGLPPSVGATTINKVCASGLKAITLGAVLLRAEGAQAVVAGGMESMSGTPHLLPGLRAGLRLGHGQLRDSLLLDGLWCALEDVHMGMFAERLARRRGLSRATLDAWALESHRRALAARESGAWAAEIVPVFAQGEAQLVTTDECPRADTSAERLAQLAPAFAEDGVVTAGNASVIADGAAALVLARRDAARAWGRPPLARLVSWAQVAGPPADIFTAPVAAVQRVLHQVGLRPEQIDLYEINEAFAPQIVADVADLGLDARRVNVHGGAIALGHPIGASGARIVVTLVHALRHRQAERGLAAICLGGGEALTLLLEVE